MKKRTIAFIFFVIVFFGAYSWFGAETPYIYNSPDETANYFFIRQIKNTGDFIVSEPLNSILGNALHPRSISWNGYSLVPQGFIGLPLFYGLLSKIFGFFLLKFFTPALAVLGALSLFGILGRIFNHKIAFLSMIFLLIFPVYWYYSSRYLYPNVPALALFLIGIWALVSGGLSKEGKWGKTFIFASAMAISIAIRPIEALWIMPAVILGLIFYRNNLSAVKIAAASATMIILALPVLMHNYVLYGDPLGAGYGLTQTVQYGTEAVGGAIFSGPVGPSVFLPYGFHPLTIAKNIYKILIQYFWWYSVPAILGFIMIFFHKLKKEEKLYLAAAIFISAWLAIYYGAGNFSDNPNGRLTMGDSHFRYWLPIFALMMPFAAFFWIKLGEKLKQRKVLLSSVLVFTAFLSIYSVLWSVDDGLKYVKENLSRNYEVRAETKKIVPEESIIITGRQDKIFFPEIKVLYAERLDNALLLDIVKTPVPFYYYGVGLSQEELLTNNNLLRIHGFRLERVKIFGKEVLYKLEKINEAAV